MCGLPGNHDPAHAAAGRLPVRFHKYSDVRLYWREFSGSGFSGAGNWLPEWQQRFVALIVLTNAGEPVVDERSVSAIMDFRDYRKPVLWGEVTPEGARDVAARVLHSKDLHRKKRCPRHRHARKDRDHRRAPSRSLPAR
jgi:hypothetical protein